MTTDVTAKQKCKQLTWAYQKQAKLQIWTKLQCGIIDQVHYGILLLLGKLEALLTSHSNVQTKQAITPSNNKLYSRHFKTSMNLTSISFY